MISINKKGSTSIRTVFPLLLLVAAMVCVSATIFVNTSEDVEGENIGGINYSLNDEKETATVAINSGVSGAITIPKEVTSGGKTYTVTSISINAFFSCTGLAKVTFGDDSELKTIDVNAFYGCSGLEEIIIPSGVTSIGSSAFSSCTGLTSIIMPSGVTSIGIGAFNGCSGLEEIIIPSGVTSIGLSAFNGCSGLTKVTFEEGSKLESIGDSAFYGCSLLTEITIPAGVTSIGLSAFSGCFGLTKVTFGDDSELKTIGIAAFRDCFGLEEIIIPSGVTSIGNQAFQNCFGLEEIIIPSGVTSIGDQTFRDCSGLKSIIIPSGVISIGNHAFQNCSGLKSIIIPSGVTSIGSNVFRDCSKLTSIEFESNLPLSTIGSNVFINTNLTTVTISGGGNIEGNILDNCFKESWTISGSPEITTLVINTDSAISVDKVSILEDNVLKITSQSENVTGADGKVIFNAKIVAGADRADDDREYKGTKGLWVAGTTDVEITVVASPAEGGVSGTIECSVGDIVEAIAKNKNGYSFIKWTDTNGDLLSSDPTYSFQAKENTKLTAVFEIIMIDLSVRADPSHQGEVKGSGTYEYGTIVKITATPNKGYKFVAWSDGITDAERSVKLTTDTSLTAYFVEDDPNLCTITVVIKGNGNVYGMGTFAKGTVITLNASPDQGYSFQGWSHTPYAGQTVQLSVESDMVITATFSQNDTGIGGSNTTIDTTTVIIIVVVIVVIFGIVVAVSLIRGRGSV